MAFSISHTISTLNQYNPSSRALWIILVSRVDTDAILKKPYDILYLLTKYCIFNLDNWIFISQMSVGWTNLVPLSFTQ